MIRVLDEWLITISTHIRSAFKISLLHVTCTYISIPCLKIGFQRLSIWYISKKYVTTISVYAYEDYNLVCLLLFLMYCTPGWCLKFPGHFFLLVMDEARQVIIVAMGYNSCTYTSNQWLMYCLLTQQKGTAWPLP